MSQLLRRALLVNKRFIWKSTSAYSQSDGRNWNNDSDRPNNFNRNFIYVAGATAAAFWGIYKFNETKRVFAAKKQVGDFQNELPTYTLDEVSVHDSEEKGIWVIYKQGVYDITKYVSEHPGGERIKLAAGSSVEPFWLIFGIHKNEKILKMLEDMRIGNVSQEDSKSIMANMDDPYANDPRRHAVLKATSLKPYNAEPVPSLLVESYITPSEIFYVRNHLPVPLIDAKTYELEIEIEGKKQTMVLSLDDLKRFPKHTVTATVMCAGNRRGEMSKVKQVKGLSWGYAAIGNATWTGARLRDVLTKAGVSEDNPNFKHVQFEGLDTDPTNSPYGSSIRFHKAMDRHGDVILAYEMNGEPISRDHGYPVRVIVPGVVGARNVKWLGKIIVSSAESDAFWQQNDYKGFSPSVDWTNVDFSKSPAIQELPVISAVCVPQANDNVKVENGHIVAKGYAWSGGGQKIVRVDVTIDGGKTWHVAGFDKQDDSDSPKHWSWTLWTVRIPVEPNTTKVEIWAKAVDSAYNTQPESFENIWNLRGVLSNAYHRVPINLKHK